MILTTTTAKKYFGNANAIGKTIELALGDEKTAFAVAGIAEPSPEESSIVKRICCIGFNKLRYCITGCLLLFA